MQIYIVLPDSVEENPESLCVVMLNLNGIEIISALSVKEDGYLLAACVTDAVERRIR